MNPIGIVAYIQEMYVKMFAHKVSVFFEKEGHHHSNCDTHKNIGVCHFMCLEIEILSEAMSAILVKAFVEMLEKEDKTLSLMTDDKKLEIVSDFADKQFVSCFNSVISVYELYKTDQKKLLEQLSILFHA